MRAWRRHYRTGRVGNKIGAYNDLHLALNLFRFVRRGRAAHADDPDFDIESDVEDGELTSWLERPGKSVAFQIIHWQDSKKLVKYLPPGNLKELYQHYASSRSLLGLKSSSFL